MSLKLARVFLNGRPTAKRTFFTGGKAHHSHSNGTIKVMAGLAAGLSLALLLRPHENSTSPKLESAPPAMMMIIHSECSAAAAAAGNPEAGTAPEEEEKEKEPISKRMEELDAKIPSSSTAPEEEEKEKEPISKRMEEFVVKVQDDLIAALEELEGESFLEEEEEEEE
jgi:hypothetical protein